MRRKGITRLITAIMAVIICALSIMPTAFAEDEIDLNKIDLDKFGDVITNEELGYNISTSGIFTKEQLEEIINSPTMKTRAASTTVTLSYCYDTGGNVIKGVTSTSFHREGGPMYRLKANADGANVYCIEPGVYLAGGINLSTSSADVWNNLTDNQQRAINAALCYGLEGSRSKVMTGTINEDQAYIATQLVVWELVKGQRNTTAPYSLKSGKNGYISLFCANKKNPNIRAAYNKIVDGMSKFQSIPSMTSRFKSTAPTYTLDAVYNEQKDTWTYGSKTINDANGVLSNFDFSGTYDVGNAKVKITQSGNKLKLTALDGKRSGTPKNISVTSSKSGIPKTNKGYLVAYGSPSAQDVIAGGIIDPPVAYMNVEVKINVTGKLTRDARIQKSCWTQTEADDDVTMEGEGSLSTEENLQGWYFLVKSSSYFKSYYGVDSFVLGPTDKAGFTQSLSEYIIENIDDELTHGVPQGLYEFVELGKLREGKSGKDLENDYYFPTGWRANNGITEDGEPLSGMITFMGSNASLDNIGHASNIFDIPFKLKKISECDASVANFYFTATNKATNEVFLMRTNSNGDAYLTDNSKKSTTMYLLEGTYVIHELGLLKEGASGDNYTTDYAIPSFYDPATDIEVDITADAYKLAQEEGQTAVVRTITNTVSSYIRIVKKDKDTGKAIANTVFGIYLDKECTSLIDTITTGADGTATTETKYSTGTYYVQEITPAQYYQKDETVHTVKVEPTSNENNVVVVNATNEKFPSKIRIYKTDCESGYPLVGAKFGVYSNKACTVLLETITTQTGGFAVTKAYKPGTVLYFKEISAPSGYMLSPTVTTVTIPDTAVVDNIVDVSLVNSPYKAKVSLRKTDSETGAYLKGAVYGLYSDKECTKLLERLTTDENGYAESETDFIPSTLYLKEITPPENYLSNDTVYPVKITVEQATQGVTVNIDVEDDIEKAKILIYKYDPDNMAHSKPVEGATYGLYLNEECTKLSEKLITGKDGSALSTKEYRIGQVLYLKELVPANGYQLNKNINTITITKDKIAESKTQVASGVTVPEGNFVWQRVYDLIYKPSIAVYKTDSETGVPVAGATYELYDPNNKYPTRVLLTTDKNGYAQSPNTYYPGQLLHLKETQAAEGYTLDETTYEIYVDYVNEDNFVIVKEVQDVPKNVKLTIKKTCAQTKLPVEGAAYRIFSNNETDENGAILSKYLLGTVSTDKNGLAQIPFQFAVGEVFYIQEWKVGVPYGYLWNKQIITVEVEKDMNPVIPVTNQIKTGLVYIEKQNYNGNSLPGVTFEVYTKDGERVRFGNYGESTYYYSKSGPKDTITIPKSGNRLALISMPLGEYYLIEKSTLDGYMPYEEKIEFSVELENSSDGQAKTVEITVKNHDSVLWDTGGTGNSPYYTVSLFVFLLTLICLAVTLSAINRKTKKSN